MLNIIGVCYLKFDAFYALMLSVV